MDDWTVTLTLNLSLTLKKEKREFLTQIFFHILKWTMTCKASLGVAMKNFKDLSRKIFSGAGDRLAQKMSSYVES